MLYTRDIASVLGRPPQLQKKELRIPQSRCSGGERAVHTSIHTDTEESTSSSIMSVSQRSGAPLRREVAEEGTGHTCEALKELTMS